MYKVRTKDGVYFFKTLEDLFWFINSYENEVLASDDEYIKIYFIDRKVNDT